MDRRKDNDDMARDFSRDFYNSQEWKRARAAYWKQCGGLCELCLKEGKHEPAAIIHHRIPLTEENIHRPEIRTGTANLQALCRYHHEQVHSTAPRRYYVAEDGTVYC